MKTSIFAGMNILLVEEEVLIAMDIEELCYEHGAAKVVAVSSLAKLAPGMLDEVGAAILDVKVGGEWTTDLARELQERHIPFIFATSYLNVEPFFSEFSDIEIVPKPYSAEELAESLAAAMSRTRSGDR